MADAGAALSEVLAWVRDVTSESPTLRPIVGVSESELRQLARLAALLRGRLADGAPADLVDALTASAAIEPPSGAVSAFDRLVEEDAVDHLADLYAAIVKPANRRPLGTFFTPRVYAKAIVDGYASRHDAPAEIIDVGAGVGIFSEVARAEWPTASIHAIDINPLTLGLQAVAAFRKPEWNVRLELADYRVWLLSRAPTKTTLYLGNPPYTRWQLLDHDARAALLESAQGLVGPRSNLSTLFLAMTLAKLRREDSLAMIIPAGWMRADYGKKLRARLRDETHRRVSLRLADSWRFDHAIVDAVLVELGPESSSPQEIEVSDWSGSEQLSVARTGGEAAFSAPGRSQLSTTSDNSTEPRLEQFARVTRGTASGAYKFFVKLPADWDALGIPARFRRPLARRLRPGAGLSPLLESAELLVLEGYERGIDPSVDAWINAAEARGLHERQLCARRRSWFDLSAEVKAPDAIVSALARETFHVLANPDALTITNNLFGLYWKGGVDEVTKGHVMNWLRSSRGQAALRESSSVEANGLRRLSPRAIGLIPMGVLSRGATGVGDSGFAELVAMGRST